MVPVPAPDPDEGAVLDTSMGSSRRPVRLSQYRDESWGGSPLLFAYASMRVSGPRLSIVFAALFALSLEEGSSILGGTFGGCIHFPSIGIRQFTVAKVIGSTRSRVVIR